MSSLDETCVEIIEGDLTACLHQLEKQSLRLLRASELAHLRIHTDAQSTWSQHGFWVAENVNYQPNGNILFSDHRYNPLLKSLEAATQAHREGHEFYLRAQVVRALEERAETEIDKALHSGVLRVPRKRSTPFISSTAFDEDARTHFLFRAHAQTYGTWLQQQGIHLVKQENPSAEKKSFSRPLWISGLNYWSNIDCDYGLPILSHAYGRVGGVRERTSTKNS